jgi:uncharacterized membrane protein
VDVVPLGGALDGLDAQISGLELPAEVGEGQSLRLHIDLRSQGSPDSLPTDARLVIEQRPFSPGAVAASEPRILFDQPVQLTGEPQRLALTLPPPPENEAFQRYIVRLDVEGDIRTENNTAEAFTLVRGSPRVLLVEGTPAAARPLQEALAASDLDVTRVTPDAMPASLGSLVTYDAVVLIDVRARDMRERAAESLVPYVRDLGRGLIMVGGPQSFGAGGWRDNPVEQALPVDMELRDKDRQPPASVVIIIDVSGSMAMEEGGVSKVELAAAGAARIADNMRDEDELTVIPFDTTAQGIVGPLPGTQRQEAIEEITRIGAGGGGINIHDAMAAAAGIIRQSDKPVRHIITLTDGADTVQQEGARALVEDLRDEGVTVSSIAIGDGKDVPFLEGAARSGDGRFILTEQPSEVPDILLEEAELVMQPFVIEEEFTPRRHGTHPILEDITATPPLRGYVATSPKDTARVLLSTQRDDPLLATWQYGLGRGVAWTSDMRGQWATDWLQWAEYQAVATRMVSWVLPSPDTQNLTLETQVRDGQLVLLAQTQDNGGSPASGWRVAGQMFGATGEPLDIVLREVAPGSYRLAVDDMPPGVYLVQLLATDEQGETQASLTGGAVVPFSPEYRSQGGNPALLTTLAADTGGRSDPAPAAVFAPTGQRTGQVHELGLGLLWLALLLLPLDVAIRRVFGRQRAFYRGQSRLPWLRRAHSTAPAAPVAEPAAAPPSPAPPPAPEPPPEPVDPLERLRAAKERARKRARGEE